MTPAAALWLAVSLAGWGVAVARGRASVRWSAALLAPALSLTVVIVWIAVAALLPAGASGDPVWMEASAALARALPGRIAIAPEALPRALLGLLAPAAVFWLAFQHGGERREARRLAALLFWTGVAQALYGVVNLAAGNARLLWFARTAYLPDATGGFVNRNHFATFEGLALLAGLTLLIPELRDRLDRGERVRSRVVRALEAVRGRPTLRIAGLLAIGVGLLASHSRMGLLATALGVALLLVLHRATGAIRSWRPVLIAALAGVGLLWAAGAGTLARLQASDPVDRLPIFGTAWRVVEARPWTGVGAGGFAAAFARARGATLPQRLTYAHAHDDYLEAMAELGLPAALLLVAALAWPFAACARGLLRTPASRGAPALALSAGMLVGAEALVDFPLHIPALALWLAALAGAGLAQALPISSGA